LKTVPAKKDLFAAVRGKEVFLKRPGAESAGPAA
jgi:hypothetical protein